MQDKAIAAIGEWQPEENKHIEQVDLYIENMFPGKDYQMLLLVFELVNKNGEFLQKKPNIRPKRFFYNILTSDEIWSY